MSLAPENFPKYPKIQSLYKRDNKGNFTEDLSSSYFEYLYANKWIGTEKIHGTNLRIAYDNKQKEIELFGRGNNSEIPYFVRDAVSHYLNIELLENQFATADKVVLFGEGFGKGIQDVGKKYNLAGVDFILFDVWIDGWWLQREDVVETASNLGMRVVPKVFQGGLGNAEKVVESGFYSFIAEDKNLLAEGLVLKPAIQLFDRKGQRIITKIKTEDYQ